MSVSVVVGPVASPMGLLQGDEDEHADPAPVTAEPQETRSRLAVSSAGIYSPTTATTTTWAGTGSPAANTDRQRDRLIQQLAGLGYYQYTSIAFTERLAEAGIDPSVGSVGDAYDNALAESVIGLFKTELIKPRGPWRTVEQVEIATLEYVDWFNHRRLYESCGDIPPAELEAAHYRQHAPLTEAGHSSP